MFDLPSAFAAIYPEQWEVGKHGSRASRPHKLHDDIVQLRKWFCSLCRLFPAQHPGGPCQLCAVELGHGG